MAYTSGDKSVMKTKREFNTRRRVPVKSFLRSRIVSSTKKFLLALTVATLACFSVSCGGNGGGPSSPEVVAKVGSRDITLRQVDIAIKQQLDAGGGVPFTPAELVAARLSVLDNLIQEEALFQKAQKEKLEPDDNKVTQELQKRKQDAGLTEEQYQEQLKQAGLSESEHRENLRREIAITALRDAQRTRINPPTEEEIRKYYDENRDQFRAERGVDISVIAVSPNNNGGEVGAEQKIKSVYAQLRGGSDFATVASQKSEEQASALRGGRIGFYTEAQLKQQFPGLPSLPSQIIALSEGQSTEPMKDSAGNWYIFKLNGKRDQAQNLNFDDVRKNIVDALTQQRQQLLLAALVTISRSEVTIKNLLAERIVTNPKSIMEMKPSELLPEKATAQPTPRMESQATPTPAASPSPQSSPAR